MKIKSKTMLGVSLFAMTFSFGVMADDTCKTVPTCAELGYTATSCSGDSIKCPFNTSKLYCLPVVPHLCNSSETKIGDIYYSDDICSSEVVSGKTAIGVVYDTDRKLVLSLDQVTKYWNDGTTTYNDISTLTNYTSSSTAQQDFDGKSNTDKIVAYATSSGQTHQAAQYCHDKTTGGKTWYLPALGEMMPMGTNYSTINTGLSKAGGTSLSSSCYWSSTEYNYYQTWVYTTRPNFIRRRYAP